VAHLARRLSANLSQQKFQFDAKPVVASIFRAQLAKRHPDRCTPSRNIRGFAMLMITRIEESDSIRTLKLEGKLQGPWVEELQTACERAQSPASLVRLDLAAVSFVDTAGVDCLQELIQAGVPIVACSGFVARLLDLER
jgi:ABC-type transporter Mla MlaB component